MQKIGLLIDSTTLTRDDIDIHDFVKAVELNVTIDDKSYKESELTKEDMLEYIAEGKRMKTSQPAPGEFLEAYEAFMEEGYSHVLVVTLSDKISGTYQAATIAKDMVEGSMEIEVRAPRVASFGVALGVAEIVKSIESGATFSDVIERYEKIFEHSVVMFTLENLMHLFHGGRLNKMSALIGKVLRIKPIVVMDNGKLELRKKVRTYVKCFDYFVDTVEEAVKNHEFVNVDIIHLSQKEWGDKLYDEITRRFPDVKIHMTDYVSPVFYAHLGDKGFGIALTAE